MAILSDRDALTSPASGDLLFITDVSDTTDAATGTDKKITYANLLSGYQIEPAEGAFANGDKTKLDGIETGADVTDTANVTAAGALMDSEVDADIKTLSLPANTTISAFGATLVDDADAATARTTLGVDVAGTDNSTDVTFAGTGTYISLSGQQITVDPIDVSDLNASAVVTEAEGIASNDNDTTIPTSAAVKDYVDSVGGGASALADLTDVDASVATPSDGDILVYRDAGSDWVLETKPAGGSNPAMADITDVTITTVADNDIIAYDSTSGDYINQSAAEAGLQAVLSEGAFVNGDKTKLDGIETGADVTDTTNVTAAGALMDSEVTNLAQVKAFSSADYAAASHTHTASAITDFDTEVSNNTDVAANTSARHAAVTKAGTGTYVSLSGQQITVDPIDLTTDVTGVLPEANLPDASTTAQGVSELATTAEVDTGTDTGRTVTPDALAGSYAGTKSVAVQLFAGDADTATGDGKAYFMVPAELNGMNLVGIRGGVVTAGTTGTTDIQVHNVTDAVDMLSTKLTIDSGETTSATAATAAVINTSNDDVATNDVLRFDVDAVSTTAAVGLFVTLSFRKA